MNATSTSPTPRSPSIWPSAEGEDRAIRGSLELSTNYLRRQKIDECGEAISTTSLEVRSTQGPVRLRFQDHRSDARNAILSLSLSVLMLPAMVEIVHVGSRQYTLINCVIKLMRYGICVKYRLVALPHCGFEIEGCSEYQSTSK